MDHDIDRVYLEVYYNAAQNIYAEREDLTSTYILSDYMKPSLQKISYLLHASTSDYWANGFFPARRNWTKLFDDMYVADTVSSKLTESYRTYAYPSDEEEYYAGKGYVANLTAIEDNNFSREEHFERIPESAFSEDSMRSLLQIIEYCGRHDIELILFSAPMTDFLLADVGNYDDYIAQVKEICEEYGLAYYDFNLCREAYFSYDCSLFKDDNHLNREGAEAFSRLFSAFFTGGIREEDLFYDSYEEKMAAMGERVFGIIYHTGTDPDSGERSLLLEPVQNGNFTVYATVSVRESAEEEDTEDAVLLPFGELPDIITLPAETSGELKILIYDGEGGNTVTNRITITY